MPQIYPQAKSNMYRPYAAVLTLAALRSALVLGTFYVFAVAFIAEEPCIAQVSAPAAGKELISSLNLDYPGMDKVKAAAQRGDLAGVEAAYLDFRRTRSTAKFTVMPSDRPANAVESSDPAGDSVVRHQIKTAERASSLPPVDMGRDFDWTYNPVPKSDPTHSDEWTYAVDRMPFWKTLADAYWKTQNEQYAQEWVRQLNSFIVKNPRDMDGRNGQPQIWRPLDAAIRVSDSWPYTYYHMVDSPSFTPQAEWAYLDMMQQHGDLLSTSIQDPSTTGNWVTTECYGLFSIATLFPEMKQAPHWRQLTIDRIVTELNRTVGPDGFEVELSPSYHLVALNALVGPLQLANLNHQPLPNEIKTKIMSMYRALVIVMEQNGDTVNTNDSASTNAIWTSRQGLKLQDDPLLEWAVSGGQSGKGLPFSTMLPYAGFYAMRGGWKPNDLYLFFRAGPTGTGHEHEDMLEVAMRWGGQNLLIDPGNVNYDHSDLRRFIIGTEAHNTITVDGKWQHRGPSTAPVVDPIRNTLVSTPLFDFASGTYSGGYQKNIYDPKKQYQPEDWVGPLDHSVTHTRRVLFLRPYYVLLLDTVDGTGSHTIDSRFNVQSPTVQIDPGSQAAFSENSNGVQIGLFPLDHSQLTASVVQGQHGAPDINWNIPTVVFEKRQSAPATFATLLYPFKGSNPSLTSTPLRVSGSGVWGQSLHTSFEDAEVAIVKGNAPTSFNMQSNLFGSIDANADGLVVRRAAGQQFVILGGWQLTSFSAKGLQFTTDAPADLVLSLATGKPAFLNNGVKPVHLSLQQPFSTTATLPPGSLVEVDQSGAHPVSNAALVTMPDAN
jgi:hypothetical protein